MTELHIEPLVHFTDLILAIGLIGLGLSILAVVITVEIYYFRNPERVKEANKKGGAASDAARDRKRRKAFSHTGRSFRSAGLQALYYKLSSKGRPFQTWIRCMPYGIKRKDTETSVSALAQVWKRSCPH